MKKVIFIIAAIGLTWGGSATALQINPTYQILTVKPGQQAEGRCTVTNEESEKISVKLTSKDWFVLPANKKFKAEEWLTYKTSQFDLNPGEAKTVQFFVKAPRKAKGELVGMMSYAFNGEKVSNVQKVLSVAVYGAIEGTEKMRGDLKKLELSCSTASFSVAVTLRNEGNVHIRPEGWCEVQDAKGQPVANVFVQQGKPLYPDQEAAYTGQVKDLKMAPGRYKANIRLTDVDRKVVVINGFQNFEVKSDNTVELK